jgi:hypothetical protein
MNINNNETKDSKESKNDLNTSIMEIDEAKDIKNRNNLNVKNLNLYSFIHYIWIRISVEGFVNGKTGVIVSRNQNQYFSFKHSDKSDECKKLAHKRMVKYFDQINENTENLKNKNSHI